MSTPPSPKTIPGPYPSHKNIIFGTGTTVPMDKPIYVPLDQIDPLDASPTPVIDVTHIRDPWVGRRPEDMPVNAPPVDPGRYKRTPMSIEDLRKFLKSLPAESEE